MTETGTRQDVVARKVIEIVAQQAVIDPADVKMTATPEELGVDSLGMVEAVFAIEEAFDVSVPFNANAPEQGEFDVSDVAGIIEAVRKLVAEQKG